MELTHQMKLCKREGGSEPPHHGLEREGRKSCVL